jgi:hypothetical protein
MGLLHWCQWELCPGVPWFLMSRADLFSEKKMGISVWDLPEMPRSCLAPEVQSRCASLLLMNRARCARDVQCSSTPGAPIQSTVRALLFDSPTPALVSEIQSQTATSGAGKVHQEDYHKAPMSGGQPVTVRRDIKSNCILTSYRATLSYIDRVEAYSFTK